MSLELGNILVALGLYATIEEENMLGFSCIKLKYYLVVCNEF